MKKAIVITLGVIIGVTGVLAICAHLADAARLALYVPEDEDGEDDEDKLGNGLGLSQILCRDHPKLCVNLRCGVE